MRLEDSKTETDRKAPYVRYMIALDACDDGLPMMKANNTASRLLAVSDKDKNE